MKEISVELEKRDVVICVACGAIFELKESKKESCPECKVEFALKWVTQDHSWLPKKRGS